MPLSGFYHFLLRFEDEAQFLREIGLTSSKSYCCDQVRQYERTAQNMHRFHR